MKSAGILVLFVLLLVLLGAGFWLYTPDKPRAALESLYLNGDSKYLEVAGVRLRVAESGQHDAPAVVFLHGFGSSLDTWEPWAQALAKDYRVIRFDLPGFGLTGPDPTGDYSDTRSVQVLAALLDHFGLKRVSLIGNSLGGRIAWRFAAAYPERVSKLILISPDGFASPGFEYGKAPEVPWMMRLLPYVLPRTLLRMNLAVAYADPTALTEATLTRYRDLMLAPGVRTAILDRMAKARLEAPEPWLRRIQAPTLLLWGKKDGMIPFSNSTDYLRAIPNATLVALPNLGHVPFEEAPTEALGPVRQFLETPKLQP
jgi:pimeloyl-ACP methyl ester carboxylesterase